MDDNSQISQVRFITVDENSAGQRIDNFLLRELSVPRSVVYRLLRKGEVRVDKKRAKPSRKLCLGESVRIPPVREEVRDKCLASAGELESLAAAIVREDDTVIIINKPSGLAVHGGSGVRLGLIEMFRQLRPELGFVELAHRLDRHTSGLVILAKTRETLLELHELFKNGGVDKRYMTLVYGQWQGGKRKVDVALQRQPGRRGKKMVVADDGKQASSLFSPKQRFRQATLMEVRLYTGRMHQIRTQLAHLGYPIIGDERYGDFAANREFRKRFGIRRLFLHAASVRFRLRTSGQTYHLTAPVPDDLPLDSLVSL